MDGEEEVNVAPSRKERKVSIGDVPAAPAEPYAPRDTPSANKVIDIEQRVGRTSMNCSLFDTYFCHLKPDSTCSRIGSKVPAPHKPKAH